MTFGDIWDPPKCFVFGGQFWATKNANFDYWTLPNDFWTPQMKILQILDVGDAQMTFRGIWGKMAVFCPIVRYKHGWKKKKKNK